MAWNWSSYDEFKSFVNPVELIKKNHFNFSQRLSVFEQQKMLFEAVVKISDCIQHLRKMGYTNEKKIENSEQLKMARKTIWELIYNAEQVLLFHKRLAQSHWAREFIYQKDIDQHWDRYAKNKRIYSELRKLIKATENLMEGFYEITSDDSQFIIDEVNLPENLKPDFIIARNLFSVGLEDVGVLIAGRGFEGVLREISRKRKFKIQIKNKDIPAFEADFFDLIELFYRLRWAKSKTRFIDKQTKTLLNYLRLIRNSRAHPNLGKDFNQDNPREVAKIIIKNVNNLWENANQSRSRFVEKTIKKDW